MSIVVSGATGNVGAELVHALLDLGHPVRALTRDAASPSWPAAVETAIGDLDRPDTLRAALDGAQAVFLLSGYRDMPELLAAVRTAGAGRVALLSGRSAASGDTTNAITAYMMRSEAAVRESGVPWTILRPTAFMSNALRWLPQLRESDVVREPFAGVPVAVIDPQDIAEVAAIVLTTDGHEDRVHELSGPESLRPADRLRTLAGVLGRDLRLDPIPDAEVRTFMSDVPTPYVEAFLDFYVDGALDESPVLSAVDEILGRRPRTFAQWATAHADAFRR